MTALGEFIRQHRLAADLTQAELARRVGVDSTYLGAIETGKKRPKGEALLEGIAESLSLTREGKHELVLAARLSQRTLRLPEELTRAQHEIVQQLVRELPQLDEADTNSLQSILAGFFGVCDRRRSLRPSSLEGETTM
ncbi:Transcriptional regulator, XRE family [Cupriavidus phytorum]|uniref:Transcriptional regulator, XRE family n=1 Tax=Cupriavidus taiwanensis TaxID=164546 RepID=A0A975ZVL4_9BURK|nr:helix-turn-helix transcriptional regulator [Cupriavidus taiwanensis]SOY40309.1 Transcriptional regulator, XRE family [Cupriavidus taiwanensis]